MQSLDLNHTNSLNETLLKIEKDSERLNFTDFDVIEKFDTLNMIRNSDSNVSSF